MSKGVSRSNKEVTEKEVRARVKPVKSRQTTEHGEHWARRDKLLDETLEQTFPASDPLSSMRPAR